MFPVFVSRTYWWYRFLGEGFPRYATQYPPYRSHWRFYGIATADLVAGAISRQRLRFLPARTEPKQPPARRFGYRKSVSEIGVLGVGVCRKRRERPYRSCEIGRPNIFDWCRRFKLMNIYLGSYCMALGGWVADSGLLTQLGGLKTLLSDCHVL